MDLTRDIVYRGFTLNEEDTTGSITNGRITGCFIDSADFSDVDVVQFLEKRSQQDGMDAGEVFLGARRLRLAGTLYGVSRPELYDALFSLRSVMSPVLASREEPLDRGYRPLTFYVPTARLEDYPAGVIPLQLLAMPRAFSSMISRDMQGGDDVDALAIPWQATFICRDPGIYATSVTSVSLGSNAAVTGATGEADNNIITKSSHGLSAGDRVTFTAGASGTGITIGTEYYVLAANLTSSEFQVSLTPTGSSQDITVDYTSLTFIKSVDIASQWTNRGSYLSPVSMLFDIAGTTGGTITGSLGGSSFVLTVPAGAADRIVRVKGADKVVTLEEETEVPNAGLIEFTGDTTWPLVAAGESDYSLHIQGLTFGSGGAIWFSESYA
jgi:hypothetical protein